MCRSLRGGVFVGWLVVLVAATSEAQKTTQIHPGQAGSPHVRTEWLVTGANISIEYGRPSLEGRTVGKDVEPLAGKVWRTGADEATTLRTDADLTFGNVTVPAGSYTLWTLTDQEGGWKLIINKRIKGEGGASLWGTQYSEQDDFAHIGLQVERLDQPVEQLAISIDKAPAGGVLKVEWGHFRASTPFTVKKTS